MLKNKLLRACTVLRLTKERLNGCELSAKIVAFIFTSIIVSNLGNFKHSKRLQLKNPLTLLFANLISFKICSLQKSFHWCRLSWLLVLPPYLPVPLPIRGNHWCPLIPVAHLLLLLINSLLVITCSLLVILQHLFLCLQRSCNSYRSEFIWWL